MVRDEEHAHCDKPNPVRCEAKGCPVPVAAGIKQRDERGQNAVTDAAEGQAHAVRRHAPQHMGKGKVFAGHDGNGALAPGHGKADGADEDGDGADGRKAPLLVEKDTQRRAQRHAAVGADAVEADDFGSVFRAGAGDSPERGAGRAQALAHTQNQAAGNENGEAEPVDAVERRGARKQRTTRGAAGPCPTARRPWRRCDRRCGRPRVG